ncbi:hypothetical protein HDV00_007854 [Rhizophlyctis rosea]|nr:hypothetical protein HDV00_007854 [Rhizophlyctis rosea]
MKTESTEKRSKMDEQSPMEVDAPPYPEPSFQRGRGRGRGGRGFGGRGRGRGGHGHGQRHAPPANTSPAILEAFTTFSTALDDMHDRRERIIKISRDITIASKRMIFLLHRVSHADREHVLAEARAEQRKIVKLFEKAAVELQGNDFYKHHRSIGPGYEEYVEAASFLVFVERGELATQQELQAELVNDEGKQILPLTNEDYLLGLADLTGELMRYCINIVGKGEHDKAADVRDLLRRIKDDFEIINSPILRKKMGVMRGSLRKVEDVCYAIKVRGSEYPPEYFQEHDSWRHSSNTGSGAWEGDWGDGGDDGGDYRDEY